MIVVHLVGGDTLTFSEGGTTEWKTEMDDEGVNNLVIQSDTEVVVVAQGQWRYLRQVRDGK